MICIFYIIIYKKSYLKNAIMKTSIIRNDKKNSSRCEKHLLFNFNSHLFNKFAIFCLVFNLFTDFKLFQD